MASKCSFCNKELSSKKNVIRHSIICKENPDAESRKDIWTMANKCSFCNKELSNKISVVRHSKTCKENPYAESGFSCICGCTFSRKDALLRHHKQCSLVNGNDSISHQAILKKTLKCYHTDCQIKMKDFKEMIKHLKMVHHMEINPVQIFKFSSESEFKSWKENEEIKSFSYFSKQSGKKGKYTYYFCQHHGSNKPHRKSTEPPRISSRKKKIGQIKKNSTCIARIIVKTEGSSLGVEYYSTHSHPLNKRDLAYQPATSSASLYIQKQIALNVPAKDIYQSLQSMELERENKDSMSNNRTLMITEKSIKQRILKLKKKYRHHEDDATSVYHLVNELKQEEYNSVILYKPLGMDIQVGPDGLTCLSEEIENLFMIGLQTKEQRDLLVEGAKKILIADDTHTITQYDNIRLLNILVLDEDKCGWPVGHFISNSMASNVIAYFVRALNTVVRQTGEELKINCLINDPALINGFDSGLNPNIRHIRRMDDIINVLLQIERDDFSKRKRLAIVGPSLEACQQRHKASLSIPDNLICTISPFFWQIASSTKTNQYYFVEKIESSCSADFCFEKCSELSCLGLCSHSYQCSCLDTHPICKHQHKLHSYLRGEEPIDKDFENLTDENLSNPEDMVPYVSSDETSNLSETRAYERLTQNLEKVKQLVDRKNLPPYLLQSGIVLLEQFIRRIETEVEPDSLELKYFERKKIHPREKITTQETQLLPFKQKKKRKSKKSEEREEKRKRQEDLDALILSCLNTNA